MNGNEPIITLAVSLWNHSQPVFIKDHNPSNTQPHGANRLGQNKQPCHLSQFTGPNTETPSSWNRPQPPEPATACFTTLQAPFSEDLTLILGKQPVPLRPADHFQVFDENIFLCCYARLCYRLGSPSHLHTHTGNRAINCPVTNIQGVGWMCECWQDDSTQTTFTSFYSPTFSLFWCFWAFGEGCFFLFSSLHPSHVFFIFITVSQTLFSVVSIMFHTRVELLYQLLVSLSCVVLKFYADHSAEHPACFMLLSLWFCFIFWHCKQC